MEKDLIKSRYLRDYRRADSMVDDLFDERVSNAGQEIVELLTKKGFTYDDAYASLQYAYDKMRYDANFLKLPD